MIYEALVEPWYWGDWMWRGMLTGVLVAVPCAMLGVFMVLRGMSMLVDAIAHVALPGVIAGFLFSGTLGFLPLFAGALIVGLGATWLIGLLGRQPFVKPEAAIGIVFTTFFAIGVILLTTVVRHAHIDADCVLFGNIMAISDRSLLLIGIVGPSVILFVLLFSRWLSLASFDPVHAALMGIPVTAMHYALLSALCITTVASFEAVGAILVIGLVIIPAATARLLSSKVSGMLVLAVLHGIATTVIGMYAAVFLNTTPAGAMVVAGSLLYGLAFVFRGKPALYVSL